MHIMYIYNMIMPVRDWMYGDKLLHNEHGDGEKWRKISFRCQLEDGPLWRCKIQDGPLAVGVSNKVLFATTWCWAQATKGKWKTSIERDLEPLLYINEELLGTVCYWLLVSMKKIDYSQYMEIQKIHVPNHQPEVVWYPKLWTLTDLFQPDYDWMMLNAQGESSPGFHLQFNLDRSWVRSPPGEAQPMPHRCGSIPIFMRLIWRYHRISQLCHPLFWMMMMWHTI